MIIRTHQDCDDYDDMSDDDSEDNDADEYVEVNTLKVVRGKRANSLKWDHTGRGAVEHRLTNRQTSQYTNKQAIV